MSIPIGFVLKEQVALHYDRQVNESNLNLRLAELDGFGHHHSGIILPNSALPDVTTEEQDLKILHDMENALTLRGLPFLGDITPTMCGLDAGCGLGGSSLMIALLRHCSMAGVSLSSSQVDLANQLSKRMGLENRVGFIRSDMTNTQFPSGTFDFIWACESTEHVPLDSLKKMFDEFARVSVIGASLVIITACGVPKGAEQQELIEKLNQWYTIFLKTPEEYELKSQDNWQLCNTLDLAPETIPFWQFRAKSKLKTGVEDKVIKGYGNGAFEYRLFSFRKK